MGFFTLFRMTVHLDSRLRGNDRGAVILDSRFHGNDRGGYSVGLPRSTSFRSQWRWS